MSRMELRTEIERSRENIDNLIDRYFSETDSSVKGEMYNEMFELAVRHDELVSMEKKFILIKLKEMKNSLFEKKA